MARKKKSQEGDSNNGGTIVGRTFCEVSLDNVLFTKRASSSERKRSKRKRNKITLEENSKNSAACQTKTSSVNEEESLEPSNNSHSSEDANRITLYAADKESSQTPTLFPNDDQDVDLFNHISSTHSFTSMLDSINPNLTSEEDATKKKKSSRGKRNKFHREKILPRKNENQSRRWVRDGRKLWSDRRVFAAAKPEVDEVRKVRFSHDLPQQAESTHRLSWPG